MLTTVLIVAGVAAQAYGATPSEPIRIAPDRATASVATVAIPGRTLRDLPGTTITYYDIAGRKGPEIQNSLKAKLADPAAQDAVRLFTWDVGTKIVKATTGTTCTIQSATSTLTANVRLPRLAEEAKVKKDVLANWKTYVSGAENEAALSLWFLSDRLRGAEKSLVGIPCDQVNTVWNAKLDTVKGELSAFVARREQAIAAQRAQAARPVEESDTKEEKMKPR